MLELKKAIFDNNGIASKAKEYRLRREEILEKFNIRENVYFMAYDYKAGIMIIKTK